MYKLQENEKGGIETSPLSISQTLQIAGKKIIKHKYLMKWKMLMKTNLKKNEMNTGRAGRFGTQWDHGFVTSFKSEDLPPLQSLLKQKPEPITQAGLHPTVDQIQLFSNHLPNVSLSSLMVCMNKYVAKLL